jgi:CheY-like chemotaxis protein
MGLMLVIEDQLLRRMNAAEILREAGYDVIEPGDAAVAPAPSPGEGRAGGSLFGAAVQMPSVRDGVDLALLIRRTYPHIRVILSSAVFGHGDRAGYVRLTPKPLKNGAIGFADGDTRPRHQLLH